MKRRCLCVVLIGLSAASARAADDGACGRFAFDVAGERALLASSPAAATSGTVLMAAPPVAVVLDLKALTEAGLPHEPGRPPRAGTAGFVTVPIARAGTYRIALSGEAWIDAIQDGTARPAASFSGIKDCPGLRKVVRFELVPGPLLIQLTGASTDRIGVAVTPER